MNKTLRQLTKEERSNIENLLPSFKKEYFSKGQYFMSDDDGVIHFEVPYSLSDAISENKGTLFRARVAEVQREYRLRKRIENMVNSNKALFLTLTFNDVMITRKQETLLRIAKKFLKEQCFSYVANIDFGSKNHRFHIHAVVIPKTIIDTAYYRSLTRNSNISIEHCRSSVKDCKKLSKYIDKLTKHSLKYNGFYKRLIYSRDNII